MVLWRFLFGYRNDLDLSSRWWHRLAAVVFVLLVLAGAGMATLLTYDAKKRYPWISDVEVLTTMHDVMLKAHQSQRTSYIEDFQALDGQNGRRIGSYVHPMHFYGIKCFVITLVGDADGKKVDPPVPQPVCFYENKSQDMVDEKGILKYRLTSLGSARLWFASLIYGVLWAAGVSLILLNFYYRGLVYIICGPRRKSQTAATL